MKEVEIIRLKKCLKEYCDEMGYSRVPYSLEITENEISMEFRDKQNAIHCVSICNEENGFRYTLIEDTIVCLYDGSVFLNKCPAVEGRIKRSVENIDVDDSCFASELYDKFMYSAGQLGMKEKEGWNDLSVLLNNMAYHFIEEYGNFHDANNEYFKKEWEEQDELIESYMKRNFER